MAESQGKTVFHKASCRLKTHTRKRSKEKLKQAAPSLTGSQACHECGSTKVWRSGTRETKTCLIQRWQCCTCGLRFSDKHPRSAPGPLQNRLENRFNMSTTLASDCRGSDEPGGRATGTSQVLNLATVETRMRIGQREATLSQQKIVDFIWYMKKNGRAESTILGRVKLIKRLAKLGADLYDPESTKKVIASQPWTPGRKDLACDAYTTFLAMNGGA